MNTLKYEDENEKLRRPKRESTKTKTKIYENGNAKTRRRRRQNTKYFQVDNYRVVVIVFSHCCHRTFVFSSSHFMLRLLKKNRDGYGGTPQYTTTIFFHSCLSIRRTKILRSWIKIVHSLIILQELSKYDGTIQYFKCWLPTPPENITGKQFIVLWLK